MIKDVIIPGAQASGDLRWMHGCMQQITSASCAASSVICRVTPQRLYARTNLIFDRPDRSFFLWKVVTQALKGRTNDECRQPNRLTDHFALIADAALAFVCESLHACENRIGVEMRFRDHIRFESAASPAIVEVGRE